MNSTEQALNSCFQQEEITEAVINVPNIVQAQTRKAIENSCMWTTQKGAPVISPSCLYQTKNVTEIPISDTTITTKNSNGEIIDSVLVFQDASLHQPSLLEIQPQNFTLPLTQASLVSRLQAQTVQLQQTLACTHLLKRLTAKVHENTTEIQILQITASELGRALGADYCWVALYNVNHTLATISGECITDNELHSYPRRLSTRIDMHRFPSFYHSLHKRGYWLSPQPELLPTPYQLLLTTESQISICSLIDREVIVGEVGILSTGKSPWPQLHPEIVSQTISQCASVLQRCYSNQVTQNSLGDLELLNQIKDNFIDSISPELRLNSSHVKTLVEMLSSLIRSLQGAEQEAEIQPNRQRLWQVLEHNLQILQEEWQQEFDLISDLLNFQSVEILTKSFPFSLIDLQQWLPQIVDRFSEQVIDQKQILSCLVYPKVPTIVSHKPSLEQIVSELLTNACRHTPSENWIAVTAQVQQGKVVIKITNTGATISPEEFDKIFQPFYQIPHPNLWNHRGTGVGLALVKKLVQLIGAEIQVQSRAKETTFTVTLGKV